MGKKSRTKGRTGELEVVNMLKALYPDVARDLDQYQQEGVVDLKNTEYYKIQVKRRKVRPAVEAMLQEVKENIDTGEVPVLMIRGDNGKWLCVMYAEHWIDDHSYHWEGEEI